MVPVDVPLVVVVVEGSFLNLVARGQSIRLSASVARSARTVTLDLLAMGRYGQA